MPRPKKKLSRRIMMQLVRVLQKSLIKYQYRMVSRLDLDDGDLLFLNYGFFNDETMALTIDPDQEAFRTAIHLYHRTIAYGHPEGKDVLEVGCGRGGGAAYVSRAFQPRSMTAIDLCKTGIEFCRYYFASSGVQYEVGDAERLPFNDAEFDVVLNVESSHCYPKLPLFFQEVKRVLRPGGYFCYTDFRARDQMDDWRAMMRASGMEIEHEENINAQVIEALSLDNERKMHLIEHKVPARMRDYFGKFAAVEGAPLNTAFRNGNAEYWIFVLRKPA